jgi:hypothetical protein
MSLFLTNSPEGKQKGMHGSSMTALSARCVMVDSTNKKSPEIADAYQSEFYLDGTYVARGGVGAGNCLGNGYRIYKSNKDYQGRIYSAMRKVTGDMGDANGIVIMHSLGGGTGSGVGSGILEDLRATISEFPTDSPIISVGILPNPTMDTVPDPYASINTCLNLYSIMENANVSILFDNRATRRIAPQTRKDRPIDRLIRRGEISRFESRDYYGDINRTIARYISCFLNLFLFPSNPQADLGNVMTIMGVSGRGGKTFRLIVPSLSPLGNEDYDYEEDRLMQVASDCFDYSHVLIHLSDHTKAGTIEDLTNAYVIVAHDNLSSEDGMIGENGLVAKLDSKYRVKKGPLSDLVLGGTQCRMPTGSNFRHVAALLKTRSIIARLLSHVGVTEIELKAKSEAIKQYTNEFLSLEEIERRVRTVKERLAS